MKTKKNKFKLIRLTYKVLLIDTDGALVTDIVEAYSFEDALIRVRGKFPGSELHSISLL